MSEENKHMNEAFKKLNEDYKVKYDSAFWAEAAAKLDDASLDDAFRTAANSSVVTSIVDAPLEVDNIFMDTAFVDAAEAQSLSYNPDFYKAFQASELNLQMDEAFQSAASAAVVDYMPQYWGDADKALQAEGLHYEYNSAYWTEAKKLLDRSDRRVFFNTWSSIAVVLLLISFSGQFLGVFDNNSDLNAINSTKQNAQNLSDKAYEVSNFELAENESNSNTKNGAVQFENQVQSLNSNLSLVSNQTIITASLNDDQVLNSAEINSSVSAVQNGSTINGINTIRTPLISLDETTLSSYFNTNVQVKNSPDLTKFPATEILPIGMDLNHPNIEINKGQDAPKSMHSISIILNSGVGNKWNENELLPTLRSSFGVQYNFVPGKYFKNLEFGVNAMLHQIRQPNLGVEKRTSVYELNGDVSKYWYKLQMKDIIFANINLTAGYRITPKHKVNFAAGIEHFAAMNSNMSFRNNHVEEITTVNNNWGVRDGINNFDVRFGIGYEYQLTQRIALQLNGNVGLFDRTNNAFMNSENIDREMNVTAGIKYTLFRKL
jgi:hypothetical protein